MELQKRPTFSNKDGLRCIQVVSYRLGITASMQRNKPLEVLIFGAGSVGSIFGARAQGPRARVTAVCRSNYNVARTRGIEIRSELWGNSVFQPDRVIRDTKEAAQVPFDFVVLATKSIEDSVDTIANNLSPIVKEHTTLVSAQNGVTSELALRRCGFNNVILSATCYISCRQPRPGVVEQISHVKPHAFYLGKHSAGESTNGNPELDTLVSLDTAFARVENAQKQRWEKMIFNAAWSPSCALFEKDTHGLLQDPAGMKVVRHLASEAAAVGRAMGIELSNDSLDVTVSDPARVPTIVPSMLQDRQLGRPLELEALCGGIMRYGRQCGIATPMMDAVYESLLAVNENKHADIVRVSQVPLQSSLITGS